ncbi:MULTISPECIES: UDP-N-acetylmuramoyl-tripeptide--D-alanyl-D-alanine ligase [Flavobacteriaceae]|uniref:UDP-N-acetylmuramoyl-tripeptide--D-alanyl-D-alanine ligase n=2 Tax=Flavobacteriaceae TaxID=49546 RepID=A0A4Y8AQV1_9FLAO|nr:MULTISPECIES: UDP-N-acetylmuramoyl-tripeptide--D-alanyl-D-alanine ligase [Flavobacteriaceae]TEW72182.1 UDP-N-acetylmuramoyl-tripeptide--D-alanyl-D-alanine ligase [Gramella jeungdoensis]
MKIEQLYQIFIQKYLVDTDTRRIRKGSLFFALKGDNFNGNKFVEEALNNGASYAVIDDVAYNQPKTILVNNVLETLQKLAQYHRNQLNIPIIALTGSNGKTTTKELINCILSKKYRTTATIGNLNNHIGVPLTLLAIQPTTEIGIIEMGANHIKEIDFLCNIARPNFGLITNFGKAHLEGFGSVEGVIKGKSELYDFLRAAKEVAFINTDDPIQLKQSQGIETITFNNNKIKYLASNPFVKIKFKDVIIQSKLIGKYNYNNIAAAIAIGNYFKVSINDIKDAIENYEPDNNRSQIINKGSLKLILDAYNANPSSMKAALENFSELKDKHKIVILGDMFELGKDSIKEHQKVADFASSLNFNKLILIGKAFSTIIVKNASTYTCFEDFKTSNENLNLKNATLLIKGSRGMALERILNLL